MPMIPKLGIDVTYHEGVPWRRHVFLESRGLAKSREKLKLLYLHHYVPIITKLDWMVTQLDRLLSKKLHDHVFTYSCKTTWQTKITTYPLSKCMWLPNLAGWVYTISSFLQKSNTNLWSRSLAKSCEILDVLCLYYNKAYDHQT